MTKILSILFLFILLIGCSTIEEEIKEESLMEKTILIKDVILKINLSSSKTNKLIITTYSGRIYTCFDDDFGAIVPAIGDTVYTIKLKDKTNKVITKVIFGNSDGCAYKYTNTIYDR